MNTFTASAQRQYSSCDHACMARLGCGCGDPVDHRDLVDLALVPVNEERVGESSKNFVILGFLSLFVRLGGCSGMDYFSRMRLTAERIWSQPRSSRGTFRRSLFRKKNGSRVF